DRGVPGPSDPARAQAPRAGPARPGPGLSRRARGTGRRRTRQRAQRGAVSEPDAEDRRAVGVGPHPEPWPVDPRLDPELLAHGDSRNVEDRFRYWRREAIVAELDRHRHSVHVAIENLAHDANIGSVVRTANAFAVGAFHIVGRRRWNRRGAMVTDRYQHEIHHPDAA